ncbi:uncharacterized protein LOC108201269 [Daucus carota subsp. sativus]|uniref:uncharacterized protein LOC108201269 n=1 Tax=Daucus carota subsp. sativus TaxID=79200 RepID=UPI003083B479
MLRTLTRLCSKLEARGSKTRNYSSKARLLSGRLKFSDSSSWITRQPEFGPSRGIGVSKLLLLLLWFRLFARRKNLEHFSSVPTEHLADKENDGSTSGSHLDALLSGITGDYNSSFGNVKGKKGDTGSLMENSDAFLSQATTVTETETTYVDSSRNEEVILDSARDTSVDHGMQRFNTSSFCLDYELPASLDTFHEEFTSNTDGYFQVGNTSPFLETQNITTEFTSRTGVCNIITITKHELTFISLRL